MADTINAETNVIHFPVADLTALKAVVISGTADGTIADVESLEMVFRWDSSSAETADDYYYVDPDSGSGQWVRLNKNITQIGEAFNGFVQDDFDLSVTSDGATLTCTLEDISGSIIRMFFSDGPVDVDTSTPLSVELTAGTDTIPVENWIYVLKSDPTTLVKSTSGFPAAVEHVHIGRIIVQSAATVQTDGVLKQHNYTDNLIETDSVGHIVDINKWIRNQWATWISGVAQTIAGSGTGTVTYATTAGVISQLHEHTFPQQADPADLWVINDSVTPYDKVANISSSALLDSLGGSLTNRYYNLVIWGVISEGGSAESKLFLNLPSGSYANQTSAEEDASRYTNYSIPHNIKALDF